MAEACLHDLSHPRQMDVHCAEVVPPHGAASALQPCSSITPSLHSLYLCVPSCPAKNSLKPPHYPVPVCITMSFVSGSRNGRGGYAPRRGRGGWSRPLTKRQEPVKPDLIKHPLGELLVSLRPADLEPPQDALPTPPLIKDCQYVTSYNWLAGKDTTILIPGKSMDLN